MTMQLVHNPAMQSASLRKTVVSALPGAPWPKVTVRGPATAADYYALKNGGPDPARVPAQRGVTWINPESR